MNERRAMHSRREEDQLKAAICSHDETIERLVRYVDTCEERERRKAEIWDKIKVHVFGSFILSVVGIIGTYAIDFLKTWLSNH